MANCTVNKKTNFVQFHCEWIRIQKSSVADPDPLDPYVFGPSGSGSISQRYGSKFGSFYHQAKIVRKTLIPTVLFLLCDFLSVKNDVNIPSKSKRRFKGQ